MNRLIDITGLLTGLIGILVSLLSVFARLTGQHILFGTEARMWLLGGVAMIAAGCFARLHVLVSGRPTR